MAVFVDIHLFVKKDGEWSKPIYVNGGNRLVANEKKYENGQQVYVPFLDDDAYKKAYTDAMILEYPATRRTGTRNHHASRADYYCLCNKGKSNIYRLFVELKSSWQVLPLRDGFKMANVDLYGEACKQICGLINEFRGKNKKFYETYPIMRASMLTIALTSNPSREYNLSKEDIDDQIENAWEEFSLNGEKKPNLIGFWKVDDGIKIEQEWENDDANIHGILYVCHIMDPYRIKSNG